jgi:nucleotide-binding universal stress UspA family protein
MKNILIPIDGSEYSQKAVEMGKKMAKAFSSKVVLLNVLDIILPISYYEITKYVEAGGNIPNLYDESQKQADDLLKKAKESFGEMSKNVETVVLEGDTANKIIEYTNANDFDLVIMGSHGIGSALNRFLMGSVTTKVLHHINKPILVVR